MELHFESRYAVGPNEVKNMDTEALRANFLIEKVFVPNSINWVYSHYDRYMAGGAMPINETLELLPIEALQKEAKYFLERRELGIINIGGKGTVSVDGVAFEIDHKEALYIGAGSQNVSFTSADAAVPAKFYLNSAPAHKGFPTKKITKKEAVIVELGALETANHRIINKFIERTVVDVCQLQMGMTELKAGSVWNTMPPHTHDRRMEVYLYFDVPEKQSICHFMGQPQETRHIWMQNEQAVISPNWSVHAGAGTSNYTFIWGMAGENLDYSDMDVAAITELK